MFLLVYVWDVCTYAYMFLHVYQLCLLFSYKSYTPVQYALVFLFSFVQFTFLTIISCFVLNGWKLVVESC